MARLLSEQVWDESHRPNSIDPRILLRRWLIEMRQGRLHGTLAAEHYTQAGGDTEEFRRLLADIERAEAEGADLLQSVTVSLGPLPDEVEAELVKYEAMVALGWEGEVAP